MVAALTQSGGGWLPEVHPSAPVPRAIAAAPDGVRLLLDANAEVSLLAASITAPVTIAVGPEGGLDERERSQMIEGGFLPVSLVGSTLRFETAAISALAIVRAMLGHTNQETSHDE